MQLTPTTEREASLPDDPLLGTVVSGSYELQQVLGEGGMGKVYAAHHVRLPRKAAVKILRPDLPKASESFERFRREAEIASSLGSQHIVQVFDMGTLAGGAPYMLMEFLEGGDLRTLLDERKRLSVDETLTYGEQMVAGLAAAHAHDVVHRDIKPENLFLAKDASGGTILKILDFGISKVKGLSRSITGVSVLGTPAYMSPEQINDSHAVDQRADVYALGVTIYEMLTGSLPFEHESFTALCQLILNQPPPAIRTRRASLTEEVERSVQRAMAKLPEERYATVREMWAELRPALVHCAAQMPPPEQEASLPPRNLRSTLDLRKSPAPPPAAAPPQPLQATYISVDRVPSQERTSSPAARAGRIAMAVALAAVGAWCLRSLLHPDAPAPVAHTAPPTSAPVAAVAPAPVVVAPVAAPAPPPPPPVAEPVASAPAPVAADVKPVTHTQTHGSRVKTSGDRDMLLGPDNL